MKKRWWPLVILVSLVGCVAGLLVFHLRADDPVAVKMLALFPQFDSDHDGQLSREEQARALASVRQLYGEQWSAQIEKMFARAAENNGSVTLAKWKQQVSEFSHSTSKATQTVMVEMGDGKKLSTDIYMPRGNGPFPVIFSRTPYGKRNHNESAAAFAAGGAVVIVQDMRGRFESEGENLPFIGCGWGEHQDGLDTVNWILKQPWCDGSIGTIGGSAGGITQNLLAGTTPAGLKAQYISVAASNFYGDGTYIGGALRKADSENWAATNKFDAREMEVIKAHPTRDAYWDNLDTTRKFEVMNVPAVHIGGWFDMFSQGTIDEFVGRQHHGSQGSRGTQKLVMGPWTHGIGQMPVGELTFPNSKPPAQYNAGRWFDHYLRQIDNGVEKAPAVAYYTMGDLSTPGAPGNQWRHADDWPIPAAQTPYYFTADHQLTTGKPAADQAGVQYTFDPGKPCLTIGGNNLTIAHGPMNQNRIESRDDVVLFTTNPLEEPLEVTGRIKAYVFVASSALDTDLSVRVCDVYPNGKSYLIAEGILRLRYRRGFEKPQPLEPGKVEQVTVDCWSTSIIFNKGHRIRATVTSSNYPRFDLNPGTGEAWSGPQGAVKQVNKIYCDAEHASCLDLPVVKP